MLICSRRAGAQVMTSLIVFGMEMSRRSYEVAMTILLHRVLLLQLIREPQGQRESGKGRVGNTARREN
jgi:hypothetical protein